MIYSMYAIKDKLMNYACPIPFDNEELAKRYFKVQLDENPIMKHNPEDFELYQIGTFDTEAGNFMMNKGNMPQLIMKGE